MPGKRSRRKLSGVQSPIRSRTAPAELSFSTEINQIAQRTPDGGPSEKAQPRPSMPGKGSGQGPSGVQSGVPSPTARAELSFSAETDGFPHGIPQRTPDPGPSKKAQPRPSMRGKGSLPGPSRVQSRIRSPTAPAELSFSAETDGFPHGIPQRTPDPGPSAKAELRPSVRGKRSLREPSRVQSRVRSPTAPAELSFSAETDGFPHGIPQRRPARGPSAKAELRPSVRGKRSLREPSRVQSRIRSPTAPAELSFSAETDCFPQGIPQRTPAGGPSAKAELRPSVRGKRSLREPSRVQSRVRSPTAPAELSFSTKTDCFPHGIPQRTPDPGPSKKAQPRPSMRGKGSLREPSRVQSRVRSPTAPAELSFSAETDGFPHGIPQRTPARSPSAKAELRPSVRGKRSLREPSRVQSRSRSPTAPAELSFSAETDCFLHGIPQRTPARGPSAKAELRPSVRGKRSLREPSRVQSRSRSPTAPAELSFSAETDGFPHGIPQRTPDPGPSKKVQPRPSMRGKGSLREPSRVQSRVRSPTAPAELSFSAETDGFPHGIPQRTPARGPSAKAELRPSVRGKRSLLEPSRVQSPVRSPTAPAELSFSAETDGFPHGIPQRRPARGPSAKAELRPSVRGKRSLREPSRVQSRSRSPTAPAELSFSAETDGFPHGIPQRTPARGPSAKAELRPSMPEKGSLPGPSGVQSRVRSRTARAELSFSVSHVEHVLREDGYSKRLGATTPIFLAAVIQFLTAKVLEQAGIEAQKSGRRRVTPDLLARAVHNHPQLNDLFRSLANSQVDPD